ncbi:DUF3967 domain-containing protein [Priestia endophytica]|uniref:DUF3967 domain-containing protein n=1 Tax=Priestia endophytica TaxID=135735 RepID=UPI000DCA804C|nr:DUF3967 domain-containing protein [Priestia endophytica]RAS87268.1 hypothetical protein A4U60_06750 [Priestia endophytica]
MSNADYEENQKAYWAKDIAVLLDVTTSNLRRWSIDLEKAGYRFYRDEHNRRAYLEKDIMPLTKLKEFLSNNMSKNDAIKAVISMFPVGNSTSLTIPVNDDIIRLSKSELSEIVKEAVREAVEEEREAMFKVFEHKISNELEQRDRLFMENLHTTLETKRLEIAATKEKKWWEFWK